jgi:sugar phosphate isomerase/epimerase
MYAGDRSCLTSLAEAIALCDKLDRHSIGGLGVAVDAYHVWWDWQVPQEIRAASGRLLAFHVCDWLIPTRDMLLDRGLMGDGVIDLRALRSAVEEAGFGGMIEIEIFSEEIWRCDPETVLSRCVERVSTAC